MPESGSTWPEQTGSQRMGRASEWQHTDWKKIACIWVIWSMRTIFQKYMRRSIRGTCCFHFSNWCWCWCWRWCWRWEFCTLCCGYFLSLRKQWTINRGRQKLQPSNYDHQCGDILKFHNFLQTYLSENTKLVPFSCGMQNWASFGLTSSLRPFPKKWHVWLLKGVWSPIHENPIRISLHFRQID